MENLLCDISSLLRQSTSFLAVASLIFLTKIFFNLIGKRSTNEIISLAFEKSIPKSIEI